jgi:hypothetical protein
MHFLVSLLATAVAAVSVAAQAPVIDLGYARYQGAYDPTINVTGYRGIRYAAAPSGKFLGQMIYDESMMYCLL